MPDFQDMDSLLAYVQEQINLSLQNEVAKVVEDKLLSNIESDVYSREHTYPRSEEGIFQLNNPANIVSELISDGTLQTQDIAQADVISKNKSYDTSQSGSFAQWVDLGYEVYPLFHEMGSAPFYEDTISQLQDGNEVEKALMQGLSDKGITVTTNITLG